MLSGQEGGLEGGGEAMQAGALVRVIKVQIIHELSSFPSLAKLFSILARLTSRKKMRLKVNQV